jgi:hypothetical protein
VDEVVLGQVLEAAQVYPDDRARIVTAWRAIPRADPVRRIFIHLDRLTPPAYFSRYGPRVVPIFNYFQAALVLLADGELNAAQVARVAVEMVQTAGHNLLTLSNSFQDLVRRGLPIQAVAAPLLQALEGALQGPGSVLQAFRPLPDIVKAFTRRVAALGAPPPAPEARPIDYLSVLDDARPRTHRARRRP